MSNHTFYCDRPPTPSIAQVTAILLSPEHEPREITIPKHAHRIEFSEGCAYDHSPALSHMFSREVFVPEHLQEITFTIGLKTAQPTETLPATPTRA